MDADVAGRRRPRWPRRGRRRASSRPGGGDARPRASAGAPGAATGTATRIRRRQNGRSAAWRRGRPPGARLRRPPARPAAQSRRNLTMRHRRSRCSSNRSASADIAAAQPLLDRVGIRRCVRHLATLVRCWRILPIKNGRQGAILPQSRTIVAADRVPVAHIPLAVGHKRLVLRAVPAAGRVARFLPSPVPARRRCNKRAPPQTSHRPAPDGASFFAPGTARLRASPGYPPDTPAAGERRPAARLDLTDGGRAGRRDRSVRRPT